LTISIAEILFIQVRSHRSRIERNLMKMTSQLPKST
jgi:hypothetical protein